MPVATAWSPGTGYPTAVQGFVVDAANRTDVLAFYHTIYTASQNYPQTIGWTGNISTGTPGTTSSAFKDDVRRRVNFYRALTGLPADIVFNATKNTKCQQAALMFSANGAISHTPPTTWTYYNAAAAEAAGNSNIYIGQYGAGAVDGYIFDPGSNNTAVGHRRWLLYPLANEMATGDIPPNGSYQATNAIWVIGNFKASAPKSFITWPNKGFVPRNFLPDRWSLSYSGANFASATVSMTQNGSALPVTVVSRTQSNIGDNTIVWEPQGLQAAGLLDVPYNITVSNISGSGVPTSYTYSVTTFNPDVLGQEVQIVGSSNAPTTGESYSFNSITQADSYQLRVSTGNTTAWSEGAETSASITDLTAADYSLIQSGIKRTAANAFHLAFPSFAAGSQGFELTHEIVPSATSQLVFYDLFRFVTTASRLSAEITLDNGASWTEIWARVGSGNGSSAGWDSSFNQRAVSLSAYADKPLRVRLIFRHNNSAFLGTNTNYGVFLDDISVTSATRLVQTNVTTLSGGATSLTLNSATVGTPLATGTSYYLRIRPNVGTRWFGDGPMKIVTAEPSGYTAWQQTQFSFTDIASGRTTPALDFDADGWSNLLEYAFETNPKSADLPNILENITAGKLWISFPCHASRTDLHYAVEASHDLVSWTPIAQSIGGAATVPIATLSTISDSATGLRTVKVTDTAPLGSEKFLRIKISYAAE